MILKAAICCGLSALAGLMGGVVITLAAQAIWSRRNK